MSGYGNGEFGVVDNITREQLATLFDNYATIMGLALPETREYTGFIDDASIAGYAKESVERLYESGIIEGKPGGFFDPQGGATRAELAVILMRFLEVAQD